MVEELERAGGPSLEFRFELMRKAFEHTGAYDMTIATTLLTVDVDDGAMTRSGAAEDLSASRRALRYGENPHQEAHWQVIPESMGRTWQVHQGKELSYTNLLDLDAAVRIALEFPEPAGVVIKHTNPCGVATGDVSRRCLRSRPRGRSALGVRRHRRRQPAPRQGDGTALTATFIEAVIAPAVADEAREILAKKANMRVVTADFDALAEPMAFGDFEGRSFLGGMLHQERDRVDEARDPWPDGDQPKVVTKRAPTESEWTALRFAWRVCAHVKSNAVIFTARRSHARRRRRADEPRRRGEGGRSEGRRGCAARQSVAASDAFFPFRDGLDALAAAGATAVVQPGGSVRDAEVIAAADEHGLAMVFTGRRHFRH